MDQAREPDILAEVRKDLDTQLSTDPVRGDSKVLNIYFDKKKYDLGWDAIIGVHL